MTRRGRDGHDPLCPMMIGHSQPTCPLCELIRSVRANERMRMREQAQQRTRVGLTRRVLARGNGVSDSDTTP